MSTGYPWTDKQVAMLCRLLAEKVPQRQIAAKIGCTIKAVEGKLFKMRDAEDPRLPKRARRRVWQSDKTALRHISDKPLNFVAARIEPRDPCFRCGVRRDIGCAHTAWEKAA